MHKWGGPIAKATGPFWEWDFSKLVSGDQSLMPGFSLGWRDVKTTKTATRLPSC